MLRAENEKFAVFSENNRLRVVVMKEKPFYGLDLTLEEARELQEKLSKGIVEVLMWRCFISRAGERQKGD